MQYEVLRYANPPGDLGGRCGKKYEWRARTLFGVARGSTCEVGTREIIAKGLNYITDKEYKDFKKRIKQIQNMVFNLQRTLK